MALHTDKRNVFEKIATLKTTTEIPNKEKAFVNTFFSTLESSKNNNDPFLFILDLVIVLAGNESVKKLVEDVASSTDSFEEKYKEKLKEELLKDKSDNNFVIPQKMVDGVKIHINKINMDNDLLKTNTDSYSNQFKSTMRDVIKSPNTDIDLIGPLTCNYNNRDGFLTVKVKSRTDFSTFLSQFIGSINLIDPKILILEVLDLLFNKRNKTKEEREIDEMVDSALTKISILEEDDSYFDFNSEELNDIEKLNITTGSIVTEIGCGRVSSTISTTEIDEILKNFDNGSISAKKVFATTLNAIADKVTENTNKDDITDGDKLGIKNNFFSRFLKGMRTILIRKFVLAPEIMLLHAIIDAFNNDDADSNFNKLDEIKKRKNIIKPLAKEISGKVTETIFKTLKKELLKIVGVVATMYAKESFDKLRKIMSSII